MSPGTLPAALAELVKPLLAQRGEDWGGARVLPVTTLESGMRLGLGEARWHAVTDAGGFVACDGGALYRFYEVVEQSRDSFDEALDQAAAALGLPAMELHLSFPAADIVRTILGRESTYLIRKALLFLRPTELREARAEIQALTGRAIPVPLKELAARLVLPD